MPPKIFNEAQKYSYTNTHLHSNRFERERDLSAASTLKCLLTGFWSYVEHVFIYGQIVNIIISKSAHIHKAHYNLLVNAHYMHGMHCMLTDFWCDEVSSFPLISSQLHLVYLFVFSLVIVHHLFHISNGIKFECIDANFDSQKTTTTHTHESISTFTFRSHHTILFLRAALKQTSDEAQNHVW